MPDGLTPLRHRSLIGIGHSLRSWLVSRTAWPRLTLALGVGALTGVACWYVADGREIPYDFRQTWEGIRLLLAGENPYLLVGPGRLVDTPFPEPYPVTAMFVVAPLLSVSIRTALAFFAAIGGGVLVWGLTRERLANPQLWVLASGSYLLASSLGQWSPLITGASLVPALGWLLACKPTIGAAVWTRMMSPKAVIGAAVFTALTIVLWPWWLSSWLMTISPQRQFLAPILLPGGWLMLLAALRWRRPEARMLLALSCIPHVTMLYDTVPLFLVVRRWWQGAGLALLSLVVLFSVPRLTDAEFLAQERTWGRWELWALYLPCLVAVLLRRNEGSMPFMRLRAAESRSTDGYEVRAKRAYADSVADEN